MPLFIGANKVKDIYLGTAKVKEIYLGTDKIFGNTVGGSSKSNMIWMGNQKLCNDGEDGGQYCEIEGLDESKPAI